MIKTTCAILGVLAMGAGASPMQNSTVTTVATSPPVLLKAEDFHHYIDGFNKNDNDLYSDIQFIKNAGAWDFLKDQIPLFECPDSDMEQIYYFRWWTYRKHIKQTPDGFVITEFLPKVSWAGRDNTIDCAAGFHMTEGRWLHNPRYIDDYTVFWLRKGGWLRQYSFWIADAAWERYLVTGDAALLKDILPDLITNYQAWEKDHLDSSGLFWQHDWADGMELSAGGPDGYRPTINSYMYGDALAIAAIASLTGDAATAAAYRAKAETIKKNVQTMLWDKDAQFFKAIPHHPNEPNAPIGKPVEPRELFGYTPWYFNLPDPGYETAWSQILDYGGFKARFGATTCEQRAKDYGISYNGHECQWNGPVWPYATSITLVAMANLLDNYQQSVITRDDYFNLLSTYAMSQHRMREDGARLPWIDENLNPLNGDWISRTVLMNWKGGTWDQEKGGVERGKDYNHSMYVDHIITGLVGLRPRADDTVEVKPLVPDGKWDYFCLDNVAYHGRTLTIFYDKTGHHYGKGAGLHILANGREIAQSPVLGPLTGPLPGR